MKPFYKFYAEGQEIDSPASGEAAIRCLKGYDKSTCDLFQMVNVTDAEGPNVGFEYAQIASSGNDGMEGWINLFFNGDIVALVNNNYLADQLKKAIPEMKRQC